MANKLFRAINLFLFCSLLAAWPLRLAFAANVVVWDQLLTHPNSMVPELLRQALLVTEEEYGPLQVVPSESMEQGRAIRQMANNDTLQVAVFAPNKLREQQAIAIRIPVTAGLLSYRICLIKRGNQSAFEQVSSLQEFKQSGLIIGQHQNWPDSQIIKANNIKLWLANKYSLLFDQLVAGRFDCFSRGANEVVQEFHSHGYKGIEIEKTLIIYYPLPLYYFVNKRYPELAKRIEKGIRIQQQDGVYERLFKRKFSSSLKILDLPSRTILELENPLLTEPTTQQMQQDKAYYKQLIEKAAM